MSASVFGSALFVQGPEPLLNEREVASRIAAARRSEPDVEVIRLDGASTDGGAFTEATGGSLFSTSSVVVVDDISQLDPGMFDLVVATAKQPPEELCLILVHPGGVKGKGLVDKLKKAKVPLAEHKAIKPWEMERFAQAEAKRVKRTLGDEAAKVLVAAVGNDARLIASAIDQLDADLPPGAFDHDAINRYFAGRAEVSAFAIVEDVVNARIGDALVKLRWALDTGLGGPALTAVMAKSFRSLGKYHDLRSQRLNDADMAREVGVPPFKVRDLQRQSRLWSAGAVAQAIVIIAVTDAAVKGAAHDASFALEQMIARLDEVRRA